MTLDVAFLSWTTTKPRLARRFAYLLEMAGYTVETSFDGEAALKAAEQFAPDACVLDISMPGMDGYELARRLVAKSPDNRPVLATVTAYDSGEHLDRAAEAGFDLHFTKPADPRGSHRSIGRLSWKIADSIVRYFEMDGAQRCAINRIALIYFRLEHSSIGAFSF